MSPQKVGGVGYQRRFPRVRDGWAETSWLSEEHPMGRLTQ